MEATNVVPKTQWSVSLFLNLIWKPENRLSTMLTALMTAILVGIAYYGLHRPHLQMSMGVFISANLVVGIYTLLFTSIPFVPIFYFGIAGIAVFIYGVILGSGTVTITGLAICIIAFTAIFTKYLWDKHKKYLPVFIVIALTVNTWVISSSLSKPDPNFVWFSKADGKVTTEETIVPLGFMDLEDLYFPVAKLKPVEIPTKISISNPEVVGWKKEEKFNGNLRVEFRPKNYEDYKAISEHGDFQQITIQATSIEEARRLVMKEISNQSGLHFGKFEIIVSGI